MSDIIPSIIGWIIKIAFLAGIVLLILQITEVISVGYLLPILMIGITGSFILLSTVVMWRMRKRLMNDVM